MDGEDRAMKRTLILLLLSVTPLLAGPARAEDPQFAGVTTPALIKEYMSRRDAAVWAKPPAFPTDFASLPDAFNKIKQWFANTEDHGRELLDNALLFAESGYPPALGIVASVFWGDKWFDTVPRDRCRALTYAFDAAAANNRLGMVVLAQAYKSGDGLPLDEARAYFWAREAARRFMIGADDGMGTKDILSGIPDARRVQLETEFLNWNQERDTKEQRERICK